MTATADNDVILRLSNVTRRFQGLIAVNEVSMAVQRGSIHGLIGPNGSGKSTTFNVISGITPATSGKVELDGQDITRLPPHAMAALGIARTFQATELFRDFTVRQNLVLAAQLRSRGGFWGNLLCAPSYRQSERDIAARADAIMAQLELDTLRDTLVSDLPHRDQKKVALANALVTGPRLLMLDEPAAGLTHHEMEKMMAVYRALNRDGMTILLVEHNMRTVMGLCGTITFLNQGQKIAEGTPREIASHPQVIEAYLGQGIHPAQTAAGSH